jgi:LPPG:FO 2-phospho-L-lactate transferase
MPSWFRLGDLDLATHIARTELLRTMPLDRVTAELAHALGIRARILPATNDRLRTRIETPEGILDFQEYFVRERWQPEVRSVIYAGAAETTAPLDVLHSIREARLIILAPSNPITSIGPILAVPEIRDALRCTRAEIVAISPLIGNNAFSGPAAKLLEAAGYDVSAAGIGRCYHDFLDNLIIDTEDAEAAAGIRNETIGVQVTGIRMTDDECARRLAQFVIDENRSAPR